MILSRKRKNITKSNISQAFQDKSEQWVDEVVIGSYHNLGITLIELLVLKYLDRKHISEYIRFENIEIINEIHSKGKGAIMMSAHYGNWEYLAYSGGLFSDKSFLIIVKPQSNEYSDKILNSYRTKSGNRIVSMYNAAREIVKSIKNKEIIALLADQSATKDKDIFVDFLGRPAATFESPAELALKFDVPIIMGFAERQDDCSYKVKLQELDHSDLSFNKNDVEELTKRHVKVLEEAIKKHPELWAWQHRRWKHTPPESVGKK